MPRVWLLGSKIPLPTIARKTAKILLAFFKGHFKRDFSTFSLLRGKGVPGPRNEIMWAKQLVRRISARDSLETPILNKSLYSPVRAAAL